MLNNELWGVDLWTNFIGFFFLDFGDIERTKLCVMSLVNILVLNRNYFWTVIQVNRGQSSNEVLRKNLLFGQKKHFEADIDKKKPENVGK